MHPTRLDPDVEADLRAAALTYDPVGRTLGELPAGYDHLHRRVTIGRGPARFTQASVALLDWQMQLSSGFTVSTSTTPVEEGTVAILRIWVGPLHLSAPCRVVYVIDEPNRTGFAYGTLPGHPESGEEAFIVERHEDERITLTINAFSRPASHLARLGGPISRLVQRRVTDRYLRSLDG